jgi:hypothetical protein
MITFDPRSPWALATGGRAVDVRGDPPPSRGLNSGSLERESLSVAPWKNILIEGPQKEKLKVKK